MALSQLSLAVVGARFPNKDGGNRQSEILFCNPGEPVHLVPEPKNEADRNAIAVFSARGFQIGYLTADRAPWIGGMLKAGREVVAVFQEATDYGAVIRAHLDGGTPELPPLTPKSHRGSQSRPPEGADFDPGFYPDEMPPDD